MAYLNFDVRIGDADGPDYPVLVLQSPGGEAAGVLRMAASDAQFRRIASRGGRIQRAASGATGDARRALDVRDDADADDVAARRAAESFGAALFDALMHGRVRDTYRRSRAAARRARARLRLRLRIESPRLVAVPWELLYDPEERDFVCLSLDTPVVRYVEMARAPAPLRVSPPLRVLGVVSAPVDLPALEADRERRHVDDACRPLAEAGVLRVTWADGSMTEDLQRALRSDAYHVLHFVGHGGFDVANAEGVLALTDHGGRSAPLGAGRLGRLIGDHPSLRLVVLNACLGARADPVDRFAGVAAALVARGVPAVVAMQEPISDAAALTFARAFYQAIADASPVDAAVTEARKAVSLRSRDTLEWAAPVLYMRAPDGVLFRPRPTAAERSSMASPAPDGALLRALLSLPASADGVLAPAAVNAAGRAVGLDDATIFHAATRLSDAGLLRFAQGGRCVITPRGRAQGRQRPRS